MPETERSLLISLASADWASLHEHIDAGRMPHLEALIERGCSAPLSSPWPVALEPALATVATGCLADRHGVFGPVQVRADRGGVEATGRRSWRKPALWDVAAIAGLAPVTVNWPGTSDARGFPAVHVDARFAIPSGAGFDTWAVPQGSTAPEALALELAGLRVHPLDDLAAELALFAPQWGPSDGPRVAALRTALARVLTVHAAATELAEHRPWDLFCIHYDWLHEIAIAFGGERDASSDAVSAQAHAFQDAMLGRLIALAGPDATVTVLSPLGLGTNADATRRIQPRGALVMAGPGIAADRLLPGLRAQDVAPTLLARFGLSVPGDGLAIADLAPPRRCRPVQWLPDAVPDGVDPAQALLDDGYRDRLSPQQVTVMEWAERHGATNHALASLWRGDGRAAIERLRLVLARWPADRGALMALGRALMMVGDHAGLRSVGEALLATDAEGPWGHLAMAAWHTLVGRPQDANAPIARALALGARDMELLVRLSGLQLMRGEAAHAVAVCEQALALDPTAADAWYGLGLAHTRLGRRDEAEAALRQALRLQSHLPLAQMELGALLLARGRSLEAIQRLQTALQQDPGLAGARRLLRRAQNALFKQS